MWANAEEFLGMILPSIIGLVGLVVGYYFGKQHRPAATNPGEH